MGYRLRGLREVRGGSSSSGCGGSSGRPTGARRSTGSWPRPPSAFAVSARNMVPEIWAVTGDVAAVLSATEARPTPAPTMAPANAPRGPPNRNPIAVPRA